MYTFPKNVEPYASCLMCFFFLFLKCKSPLLWIQVSTILLITLQKLQSSDLLCNALLHKYNFARKRKHKQTAQLYKEATLIHANIHERLTSQYLVPVSLFTHSLPYIHFLTSSKLHICIGTLRCKVILTNEKNTWQS